MEMTNVWRQFDALSPAAKRQVAEFIAFLSTRGKRRSPAGAAAARALSEEGFVGIWNDFFFPLVAAPSIPTLQVGVNNLRGYYSTQWGFIFAGVTLSAVPLLIAYVLLTKQFIRGITAGAVRG